MFPQTLYYNFKRHSPSLFSNAYWREYGMLYRNSGMTEDYGSNHAVILNPGYPVDEALFDVEKFFSARRITPRVYSGFAENEDEWLLPALIRKGYKIDHYGSTGFIYRGGLREDPGTGAVERQRELTAELLCFAPAWLPDPGRHNTESYAIRASDGAMCGYLSIVYGYECAFITNVMTDLGYRRQGYCTKLLEHAIFAHQKSHGTMPLFLDAVSEPAIRIYEKLGFEKFTTPDYWRAAKEI